MCFVHWSIYHMSRVPPDILNMQKIKVKKCIMGKIKISSVGVNDIYPFIKTGIDIKNEMSLTCSLMNKSAKPVFNPALSLCHCVGVVYFQGEFTLSFSMTYMCWETYSDITLFEYFLKTKSMIVDVDCFGGDMLKKLSWFTKHKFAHLRTFGAKHCFLFALG